MSTDIVTNEYAYWIRLVKTIRAHNDLLQHERDHLRVALCAVASMSPKLGLADFSVAQVCEVARAALALQYLTNRTQIT